MDLFAPLVHEFTYQAMVHDLLPLIEGDKIYYKTSLDQNGLGSNVKDVEIGEKDSLWVKNRHLHMKDLLEKLAAEFQAFKAKNPQFAERLIPSNTMPIKFQLLIGALVTTLEASTTSRICWQVCPSFRRAKRHFLYTSIWHLMPWAFSKKGG